MDTALARGARWQEPTLAEHFRLQGVVTVVDAANFLHTVWDVDRRGPCDPRLEGAPDPKEDLKWHHN